MSTCSCTAFGFRVKTRSNNKYSLFPLFFSFEGFFFPPLMSQKKIKSFLVVYVLNSILFIYKYCIGEVNSGPKRRELQKTRMLECCS